MIRLLAMIALLGAPAHAQDAKFDSAATADCVAATTDTLEKEACIGQSATQCMLDTPDGVTTAGMTACYEAEQRYWEDRLAQSHDSLSARLSDIDTEEAARLQEAQTAWRAHRDASCALLLARSGAAGVDADFVTVTCRTGHTAEQAMFLEEMDRDL